MNVKLAAQVVSYTVASAIRTALKTQPNIFEDYLNNAIPTANIVEQFNNIFDCLNCRNFSSKYVYQQPLRSNNQIYNYLKNSLEFLKNLKIISPNENYFKFIKGFELTINAQLKLIDHLSDTFGTEYILTGKTNQDALENFFSALRGKGGYNYMPSSHEIGVHYANIIVMKILFKSMNSNCLPDDSENLQIDWQEFIKEYKNNLKYPDEYTQDDPPVEINNGDNGEQNPLTANAITYYAGYCAHKVECEDCKKKLIKDNDLITENDIFINEKNFKKHQSSFGSLKAPSEIFFKISELLVKVFEIHFEHNCHKNNIVEKITQNCVEQIKIHFPTFLSNESEQCYNHLKTLISFFILVLLRRNCKWVVTNKLNNKRTMPKTINTKASKK